LSLLKNLVTEIANKVENLDTIISYFYTLMLIYIISSSHKKNMNLLSIWPFAECTYSLGLKYYRRIHYKAFNNDSKNIAIDNTIFAEILLGAAFINKDNDSITLLTTNS
jgi:hypothetical protein